MSLIEMNTARDSGWATALANERGNQPMQKTLEEKNKAMVLEAFDTLFNRRDYQDAERFWSPDYIQHSAHIEPGRDGLFNLIKRWIAADILRIKNGLFAEHWDVIQDEATKEQSKSGLPMFGDDF